MEFQISPEEVGQLIFTRDSMTTNMSVWNRFRRYQTEILGPPIAQALADLPNATFETFGLATHLPLSVVEIDGVPIGRKESFGFLHPRAADPVLDESLHSWEPDLVVVDRTFRKDAEQVLNLARDAGIRTIIELDSSSDVGLARDSVAIALEAAKSAIVFGQECL